jgi:hypothetical protein
MKVWFKRGVRLWLVLLPLAIYCGYESYQAGSRAIGWQEQSDIWYKRIDSDYATKHLLDPKEMFDEAISARDQNIIWRDNYRIYAIALLLIPLTLLTLLIGGKWVWTGKSN